MTRSRFAVLLVVLFLASAVFAQSNDVAVSFGGTFSPGAEGPRLCEAIPVCPAGIVSRSVDPGFSVEGTYAHRLANFKVASLHLELPFMFSPTRKSEFLGPDFSTFFFTPSLRLKFLPSSGVSPFVSAGGGLGRFKEGSTTDNHGAFQVGGGLDFKTRLPLLGFRIEARDFVTGAPSFSTLTNNHLNNLFVGGGIVFRF
jgi:opacity protein-like surface antigen